jgi:hypothetical protein
MALNLWVAFDATRVRGGRNAGPKLQPIQGSGKIAGQGLADHVGIDRAEIPPDAGQKLVV